MNGHGGRREGSGRKKVTEKNRKAIEAFESECASYALPGFRRLIDLIFPEEIVERKYVPAALLKRRGLAISEDGEIVRDDKGKPSVVEIPMFPEIDGNQMVLVEEKRFTPQPNVVAIKELNERLLGKAPQAIELTGEDGGAIAITLDSLTNEQLDALESIAQRLALGGPEGGP